MPSRPDFALVHWEGPVAVPAAHGASPLESLLAHWAPSTGLMIALSLPILVYGRGWWALHRRDPRRFPAGRLACFLAGTFLLLVALVSPLDALADALLSAHMAQHLLLMMAAPPLLWLSAPIAPLLVGLPESLRRCVVARLVGWRPLRVFARWLARPAVCLACFVGATWLWHVPALYEWALRDDLVHDVEHVCFLVAGLLFWWPVVAPWPARGSGRHWVALPYLLLAMIENSVFSAIFAFSDRVFYSSYAVGPRPFGLDPLSDQMLAGAVMWVPASLIMLLPVAALAVNLLGAPQLRLDPRS
jgi:cytochrome c oxidase assembly factor CtaG